MPGWVLALLVAAGLYALFVIALVAAGRRTDAAAVARFVPDCLRLARRLATDPRVPRRSRLLLLALVAYLAFPFDLVPDMIPVVGVLDDAILVALVLRHVARMAGRDVVVEHWPGPPRGVELLLGGDSAPSRG